MVFKATSLASETKGYSRMVQMTQIITANASAFLLLLTLRIHMGSRIKAAKLPDTKIFSLMMYLTMFQCFFDTLVFWVDGENFPLAKELNYIGNVAYYILSLFISYLWPLFIGYKLYSRFSKRLVTAVTIPMVIVSALALATPFTGFFFTITDENIYVRNGFFPLIHSMLVVAYILLGTIMVYTTPQKEGKYMFFPVICFIVPILAAIIFQALNYGTSLVFIGVAIGLTGIYMSTQNESAYIDNLCSVFNRRYYNDYIRAFSNSDKDGTVTGILIDMDNFKTINDTLGHSEGDNALILFSSVLRRHTDSTGFAVRYGGDEFIIITKLSEQDAKKIAQDITNELETINASGENKFTLGFSYGIATITSSTTSDDFLNAMDKRMYEMKQSRKTANSR